MWSYKALYSVTNMKIPGFVGKIRLEWSPKIRLEQSTQNLSNFVSKTLIKTVTVLLKLSSFLYWFPT